MVFVLLSLYIIFSLLHIHPCPTCRTPFWDDFVKWHINQIKHSWTNERHRGKKIDKKKVELTWSLMVIAGFACVNLTMEWKQGSKTAIHGLNDNCQDDSLVSLVCYRRDLRTDIDWNPSVLSLHICVWWPRNRCRCVDNHQKWYEQDV